MGKTVKKRNNIKRRTFKKRDFQSGDGMLTSVWGPSLWHYLHTLSFNYPWKPTPEQKKYYKKQILILQKTLPCKYCRINLKNKLYKAPLDYFLKRHRYPYDKNTKIGFSADVNLK